MRKFSPITIDIADGEWTPCQLVWFYNKLELADGLPIIASFVPIGVSNTIEFGICLNVTRHYSIPRKKCFFNRQSVVEIARASVQEEIDNSKRILKIWVDLLSSII